MHDRTPIRHVIVVGLMASGKTTVGHAIAVSLAWAHRDSDRDVEARAGITAKAFAARDGIEALHGLEGELLHEAVDEPRNSVVGAAASVIDDPTCRTRLQDPGLFVVWLRISPAAATRRARADRPTTSHRPEPEPLEVQAARRDPLFAEVADATIDVDDARGADRPIDVVVGDAMAAVRRAIPA
jgi:shikimate kinase